MTESGGHRGVAPVVGIALLIALVVAMGAVTATMLSSFAGSLEEPAPMFASGKEVEVVVTDDGRAAQELSLVHRGGDAIDTNALSVVFHTGSGVVRRAAPASGDLSDGEWSTGERLSVPLDPAQVCTGSETLRVDLVHGDESSYVVGRETLPVVTGGFTIEGGAVVPISDYTATATALGTGFTYGAGGPRIDIRLDVRIGTDTLEPWPGNVNNEGNPRTNVFADRSADESIAVAATADRNGIYISPRTRWSNATDGWVHVLRDGDTPPNLAGFGDQDSAADYVAPYLDADGNISLPDNEAIYLFELGNSRTGSAADFQDVVVLVTVDTEAETAGVRERPGGESVLVCPASD